MAGSSSERYAFDDFLLDVDERSLTHHGASVALKPKSFDLLVALVRRAGRLVRKEELLAAVWPDVIVTEANLSHHVWVLRQALEREGGEGAAETAVIETVPRAGYRFVASVRPADGCLASAVVSPPGPAPPHAGPRLRGRRFLLAVAAVLVTLVLAGLGLRRLDGGPAPPWRPGEPHDRYARRLHFEAEQRLRQVDLTAARDLLLQAAARDSEAPLVQATLAATWFALGDETRGTAAADRASRLAHRLPRQDRLWVDAQAARATRDWQRGIAALEELLAHDPHRLVYGLELGGMLIRAGRAEEALVVVGRLRQLPAPPGDLAAVDFLEARAAYALADEQRALAAATRVVEGELGGGGVLGARARALRATQLVELGQLDAAAADYAEASRLAAAAGAPLEVARAEHGRGLLAQRRGELKEAAARLRAARDGYRAGNERRSEANAATDLAGILLSRGELVAARREYSAAAALQRALGNPAHEGRATHNLALTLVELGEMESAEAALRRALALDRQGGDRVSTVYSLTNLATLLVESGELGEVGALLAEATALSEQAGSKGALALVHSARAELATVRGEIAAARSGHEAALRIRRELASEEPIANSLRRLAGVHLAAGDPAAAEPLAVEARALAARLPSRPAEGRLLALQARCAAATDRAREAERLVAAARRLATGAEPLRPRLEVEIADAEVAAAVGRASDAEEIFRGVRRLAEAHGLVTMALEARLGEARAARSHDPARASRQLEAVARDAADRGLLAFAREAGRLAQARRGARSAEPAPATALAGSG